MAGVVFQPILILTLVLLPLVLFGVLLVHLLEAVVTTTTGTLVAVPAEAPALTVAALQLTLPAGILPLTPVVRNLVPVLTGLTGELVPAGHLAQLTLPVLAALVQPDLIG